MRDGLTVEFDVHFTRGSAGRREIVTGEAPSKLELPEGSVPRVTRLMALAIRCEELIRCGEVTDYAELARLGHVTRARMTQIMNLLHLAPSIQEEILFLPRTTKGRDPIGERDLRPITAIVDWRTKRRMWEALLASRTAGATSTRRQTSTLIGKRRTTEPRTRAALVTSPARQ
ncbi:MAG: hypothetical protein AABZ47_05365 [Planctomycetota bacterium]